MIDEYYYQPQYVAFRIVKDVKYGFNVTRGRNLQSFEQACGEADSLGGFTIVVDTRNKLYIIINDNTTLRKRDDVQEWLKWWQEAHRPDFWMEDNSYGDEAVISPGFVCQPAIAS